MRLAACIPRSIDVDMDRVSISKMKNGKAAESSGVRNGNGNNMSTDLVWELRTIVNCHRGEYVLHKEETIGTEI